ncbi:Protein of unknown function [Fictibacillus enclensis]|uniref:DUF3987 domain-containing protein n=1 Tax=Fictibacillus enclensis TaxID=1017270 RepID=A0A0V8IUM8_9BACL|nr:YfjI family protein [Fictibacillus enclensis]KSU78475.1 hypothetical protein AS030_21860 [Fictibacillus enclensis]SCC40910.1 Protein of unknown function [Fictibacillus enclensis]
MTEIKKEAALNSEQPPNSQSFKESITQENNHLSETCDIFDSELRKEAQTLSLLETREFPFIFFPAPVATFIRDTSKALSCPPDFVAMGVLVCASVAIGNGATMELKKSWETGASLYCGVVAEPGSAKTPAINKSLKPLFDLQNSNFEEYEHKKIQYELERDNYEIELENWKKSIKGAKRAEYEDKPEHPKMPSVQQLITMDSTLEAMQEALQYNKKGVIKLHDELLGFFKGMNQYRAGADRQYWLSIWSNEPIFINRKGKEPIQIPKPFVSIIGGIQPDMIEEIVKAVEGNNNDGLIDRFLFCYPDPVSSHWTDDDVSEEIIGGYCDIITRIYHSLSEDHPTLVKLSDKAKFAYTMWYDNTEEETEKAGFPEALKGVWKKLKGLHPRILLIMHILKWADNYKMVNKGLVEDELVIFTNYIMDYFKSHAKKVFQFTQSNMQDKNAIKLMEYVKSKGEKHEKGLCMRVNAINRGKVFGRYTNISIIEDTIARIEHQRLGEIQQSLYKRQIIREFVLYSKAIQS